MRDAAPLRYRRFPGIHGQSVSTSDESFDVNLIQNLAASVGRAASPADVGKMCADLEKQRRKVIPKPWDPGCTSAGSSGLFDVQLGGDCIPVLRGDSRKFKPGYRTYRQAAFAASKERADWFGRLGYRAISGYEPFQIDSDQRRLSTGLAPWFLLPDSPMPLKSETSKSTDSFWNGDAASPGLAQEMHRSEARVPSAESRSRLCPRQMSPQRSKFWVSFDNSPQLHIPRSDVVKFFGNRLPIERPSPLKKAQKSKFIKLAEQSSLWQIGFKEWLPTSVRERMSVTISLKLNEISSRIYSELFELMKIDWFESILDLERKLTDDGFRMRAKGELEKAEADAKYRASELVAIQKLVMRCAQERSEAEAAETVLKKEEAQFLQSYEALMQSKALLEEAEREALKTGMLDDEEEENMVRLRLNIEIAEARNLKEKKEYDEANALREKERHDLAELEGRLKEREAAFKFAAEEARANNALLNGNHRYPFFSVMNRIYAYESTLIPPAEPIKFKKDSRHRHHGTKAKHNRMSSFSQQIMDGLDLFLDDHYSCMSTSDDSGYVGDVLKGRPDGNGVEWYKEAGMEYAGQFKDDLRHGMGCLVFLSSHIFYAGGWATGMRDGQGIVGYVAVDHRTNKEVAIPVVTVTCENNEVIEAKKFRRKDQETAALILSIQSEVQKATTAAENAMKRKNLRNGSEVAASAP